MEPEGFLTSFLTLPPLSHLPTCTPTEPDSYLATSLDTVLIDPDLIQPSYIPYTNSHVPFPLLKSYQRIRPGPRYMHPFRNKTSFYSEEF